MEGLKELLGNELFEQVSGKLGENKLYVGKDGDFVPRGRFNEINEDLKTVRGQLIERDNKLAELTKSTGDFEGLKAKINELTEANRVQAEEFAKQIRDRDYASALKDEFGAAGVQDEVAVKAHLDSEKIKFEDGKLSGVKEQLEKLKSDRPYLFAQKQPAPTRAGAKLLNGAQPTGGKNNPEKTKPWNAAIRSNL